ncbi:hypothetical protein LQ50_24200 [Halalkalibacter okhensis]|uniref:ABC transmembrane type-1 domain-containing protein n=1 Tax=Halalkalibacter okhensis TaxID=333138 RepID=A0A0B0I697_9BACI|nr:hypothetical protein LQ50_24200 [Halalkalibacter okhensis]
MVKNKENKTKDILLTLLTFIVILIVWEGSVRYFDVSSAIFPSAIDTFTSFVRFFFETENLRHLWITFNQTIAGFLLGSIAGAILGILISEVPWVRKQIFPYIIALNSVPKIAIAPLFVVWFGFGASSKIAIIMVTTFFPVLINMVVGLSSASEAQIRLLRSYSANSWQIFRRVKLPSSLPYLFSGLEIAIMLSVIGAIISEFVGSSQGLGYLMLFYKAQFRIPEMFAVLAVISIMGYLLMLSIQICTKKVVFWQGSSKKNES